MEEIKINTIVFHLFFIALIVISICDFVFASKFFYMDGFGGIFFIPHVGLIIYCILNVLTSLIQKRWTIVVEKKIFWKYVWWMSVLLVLFFFFGKIFDILNKPMDTDNPLSLLLGLLSVLNMSAAFYSFFFLYNFFSDMNERAVKK